jgi:putative membrane protein
MAEKTQSTANVSNGANSASTRPPLKKQDSDKDFDDYFVRLSLQRLVTCVVPNVEQIGPRDLDHHSKWPVFLRVHGSVTPEMVLPLLFVAGWSSMITLLSKFVHDRTLYSYPLGTQPVLTRAQSVSTSSCLPSSVSLSASH